MQRSKANNPQVNQRCCIVIIEDLKKVSDKDFTLEIQRRARESFRQIHIDKATVGISKLSDYIIKLKKADDPKYVEMPHLLRGAKI